MIGQNTLPMCLTGFRSVPAPAGVTTTWNLKVVFLPLTGVYNSLQYNDFNKNVGTFGPATATASLLGQFNIWTWKSEDPEPDWVKDPPSATVTLDASSNWSKARLCAAGFELINTSAELYRGGMYYGWRSPLTAPDVTLQVVPTPASTSAVRTRVLNGPAPSLQKIINLNTTVTGSARDGLGVFSLPMTYENNLTDTFPSQILMINDMAVATPAIRVQPTPSTLTMYDWMPCGGYVMGLAPQASFELRARVYYELVPDSDTTSNLQALARPCVPHSFLAQEMMAKMLVHMPCGFDYKENPFGEWFAKVLDALSVAVPAIGAVIPHPIVKGIATVAGPLLAQGSAALKKRAEKKKLISAPHAKHK